jgi:hypothetical protein
MAAHLSDAFRLPSLIAAIDCISLLVSVIAPYVSWGKGL